MVSPRKLFRSSCLVESDSPMWTSLVILRYRQNLPAVSNWPTFPQLFVEGELVGGCDIITEMHDKGELLPVLEAAVKENEPKSDTE